MTLKQETASVLAKFSDKSNERKLVLTIIDQYKLDSPVMCPDYDKTINNPVMIGTVFAKYYGDNPCPNKDLYALWCDCGIDKSLNEILGGETILKSLGKNIRGVSEQLKDPNAQALLEFIKTL